jgi:hypothetical protein
MVVWNTFPDCNGSSAFHFRVAINSIEVEIWNMEPVMKFEMCLDPVLRVVVSYPLSASRARSNGKLALLGVVLTG